MGGEGIVCSEKPDSAVPLSCIENHSVFDFIVLIL